MFDKLIESDTAAVAKPRRSYFMFSAVFVGILFLTAVVVSLYAQTIDLGVDRFDTAVLLAPVAAEAPEPPRAEVQQPRPAAVSDLPSRQTNMQRPDESPVDIPPVSTTPNTSRARPIGDFLFSRGPETDGLGENGPATGPAAGGPIGSGSVPSSRPVVDDKDDEATTPPPPRKAEEKPRPRSIGVANGIAKYLPKPPYPAVALAVRAEGEVSVQVTIDEQGNVISSHAVSGPPLLRQAAERAAWNAKFTPTLLSNQPVKVTGVIIYRFSRD